MLRKISALAAVLLLTLLWMQCALANVTFSSVVNATPANGSTATSPTITSAATQPAMVVAIAWDSTTVTINSVTTTGFGGTVAFVKSETAVGVGHETTAFYCVAAPTASTSGTISVNFSSAVDYELVVIAYAGVDQSTPCPAGDAVVANAAADSQVLTPARTTTADAVVGACGNTESQDCIHAPLTNSRFVNNSTPSNIAVGDSFGAGASVTVGSQSGSGGPFVTANVAIRVQAPVVPGPIQLVGTGPQDICCGGGGGSTSGTVTGVRAGDQAVMFGRWNGSTSVGVTVTLGTETVLSGTVNCNATMGACFNVYYVKQLQGTGSLSISISGTGNGTSPGIVYYEFSGGDTSTWLDTTTTGFQLSTTTGCGASITTARNQELVAAITDTGAGGHNLADPGYSITALNGGALGFVDSEENNDVGNAGAKSVSPDNGSVGNTSYYCYVAAFLPPASGNLTRTLTGAGL